MEIDKYKANSRFDIDIANDRDFTMRTEGYPGDAIGTGLGAAIVLIGLGVGWAISKTKELVGKS